MWSLIAKKNNPKTKHDKRQRIFARLIDAKFAYFRCFDSTNNFETFSGTV
jgi:hypothetical protein